MILRRLYLYAVSTAAVLLLATGLALLGGTLVSLLMHGGADDSSRGQLAGYTALTVVALPVWGVHFLFAQRFAARDPYERTSAIRHLYLYLVCLVTSIAAMVLVLSVLVELLQPLLDNAPFDGETAARFGWAALVVAGVWAFHFQVARADRAVAAEEGASATLRRWYMYVALLAGLLVLLAGTQGLLQQAWAELANGSRHQYTFLSWSVAYALAGGLLWGVHARAIATGHLSEDRHSTLRTLEGFIALTICIATALAGASLILYYALARVLGVDNPGGAGNDVLVAAAGPASQALVYGIAWFLTRRRLDRDAGTQEADRQAGVRRLYTNLASLVSLGAWAVGAGGLLWTLAEQLEAPIIGLPAPAWKDPLSLWVTLLVVGLAVWLAHWRQAPWADDRQSLSRRLYVWAALLGGVLAVLGGGVGMLDPVLRQLFSAHPRLNDPANLDFGRYLAVILVAAGVGLYHLRVLRADAAARPVRPAQPASKAPAPAAAVVTAGPGSAAAPEIQAGPRGRRYTLTVTGATEDDVQSALASLPPQASYLLTPEGQAVDGH